VGIFAVKREGRPLGVTERDSGVSEEGTDDDDDDADDVDDAKGAQTMRRGNQN